MREIQISEITELICHMVKTSGTQLPPDVYQALDSFRQNEPSTVVKNILGALLENADIARDEKIPIIEVENFPATVVTDCEGNNQYIKGQAEYCEL